MHSPHKLAGGSSSGGSIVGFDSALQMEMPRTTRNSGVETSSVHRHHHHQHGESTDMRQPGAENNQIGSTTMNPISTGSGTGGSGVGDQSEAAAVQGGLDVKKKPRAAPPAPSTIFFLNRPRSARAEYNIFLKSRALRARRVQYFS